MKKKTKLFIIFLFLIFNINISNAVDLVEPEIIWKEIINNEDIEINYVKNISIKETFRVDLKELKDELEKKYDSKVFFEWDTKWTTTRTWEIFERNFENSWEKKINLSIFKDEKWVKRLIYNKDLDIFVFNKSIPFIFENSISKDEFKNFIESSKNSWIYIYNLKNLSEKDINNENLTESIFSYNNINGSKSDYIWIWWDKDFVLSITSKINKEYDNSKVKINLNMVFISSFNIDILRNYLTNFLANKKWANKIILINESSKSQIITQAEKIDDLEKDLLKNKYFYLKINKDEQINNYLFLWQFINNLSSKWINTSEIYLIIIIPFLFTIISFMKHFIWLSPIWIIVPISITLLFFRVWLLDWWIFLTHLVITNIILSKLMWRYNLLYTPKLSFVLIINFISFVFLINFMYSYNLLEINSNDLIYIFLLIIISERLINLLLSKEIFDNALNFLNTLVFSILTFFIFSFDIIKILILAYPEIIILLIPINFMIWRFTWLRITEYFRFREIIKNIEE